MMYRTVFIVFLLLGFSCATWAQLRVVTVPAVPHDPSIPHQVYGGAPITFKAIVRGCTAGSTYEVVWDSTGDGDFSGEYTWNVAAPASTLTLWDIGRSCQMPVVTKGTRINYIVRVRNLSSPGTEAYGTYRVYVHPWTPNDNPLVWTNDQLAIMREVAAQETLWWLHRKMNAFYGTPNTAGMWGIIAPVANDQYSNAAILRSFAEKGRFPAYPPGTINTQGLPLPSGWQTQNDSRWYTDPYAETTMRLLNYIGGFMRSEAITGIDEGTTNGYDVAGNPIIATRISGTTDTAGYYMDFAFEDGGRVGASAVSLAACAACLPTLAGTPPQRLGGSIALNRPWEFYVQQMVDWVGFAQYDSGSNTGGWGHTANSATWNMHASAWCYWGLMAAQNYGAPHGVIVNNRHKYRCGQALVTMQNPDGGIERYGTSATSSNNSVGAALLLARWQGWQHFSQGDSTIPWPAETSFTKHVFRQSSNAYLNYASTKWTVAALVDQYSYAAGFWRTGDYMCGVPTGVHNITPREGNTYGMFWHAVACQSGDPILTLVGSHDWLRQYSTYLVRAQARAYNAGNPLQYYADFGRVDDEVGWSNGQYTRYFYRPVWSTALAAIILTPSYYEPAPIAVGDVSPGTVTEGCMGGGTGQVNLTHGDSFHPSPSRSIVAYQWDMDNSDGYSWDSGSADYETNDPVQVFTHTYLTHGTYVATLRVVDDGSPPRTDATSFTVNVLQATNAPPAVNAAGPYILHWGDDLVLAGTVSDPNTPCGDTVTITWDLDDDGVFGDATGAAPTAPWGPPLDTLPLDTLIAITLHATDSGGLTSEAESQLTVVNDPPSAITTTGLTVQSTTTDDALVGTLSAVDTENGPVPFAWSFAEPNNDAGGRFKLANPSGNTIEVLVEDASLIDDSVSEYAISVSVQDNLGAAIASPVNFTITVEDNTPPTAVISLDATTPTTADMAAFTVQYSESVSGSFGASEVSLTAGSLAGVIGVTGADDLYTVTVTLADPEANGEVGIEIAGGGVNDGNGNYYAGGTSALYTIYNWPGFSSAPADMKRYVGDACTLAVSAAYGPITPSFEWWFDSDAKAVTLVGTDEHLLIDPVDLSHAGNYWCAVHYDGAVYTSATAALEVAESLAITIQPEGAMRRVGDSHGFSVSTTGGFPPLTYTWKRNDEAVGWDADYTINDIDLSHAGIYTVEIVDAYGGIALSSEALLEVEDDLPVASAYGVALLVFILTISALGVLYERRGRQSGRPAIRSAALPPDQRRWL